MAKGKHAPAKGAIREDKVLHPKSRKVAKLHAKEQRKAKLSSRASVGGQRLQLLGDKLLWFHDNLPILETSCISGEQMIELVEAYIARNDEEAEQIKLKNSIGSGQFKKRNQHTSRLDAIVLTKKTELEEFNGCGLEIPDIMDEENLKIFQDWNGELRYVQNFKVKRYTKSALEKFANDHDDME